MHGRSIRIFLVDGTSSGLRTAELGMSTLKALVVPRASLSLAKERNEVQKTGVYVLLGPDSEHLGQKRIYVGETDAIITRLIAHNKDADKDFWDESVVFVSKDDNLTKSHVRYLEARLIGLANEAKRATVANETTPPEQGKLPEADIAEMEEFIAQARILLGSLGYDVFEPVQINSILKTSEDGVSDNAKPVFEYAGDHFDASCIVDMDAGKFIVKKDSKARRQEAPTLPGTYRNLREQLIQNGVLQVIDNDSYSYKFSQDYSFTAATPAAQVVSGTPISGRMAWKMTQDNQIVTFADWQDKLFPSESPD